MTTAKACIIGGLWLVTQAAQAADIQTVTVDHNDGRYRMHFVALLYVPATRLKQLILDYEQLQRISPQIIETRVLSRNGNGAWIRTVFEDCILFFCRRITQVERLTLEKGVIHARMEPDKSDFRFGVTRWQITPQNGKSRLQYDSEIEPDFWVPPLIGPWLLKRKLHHRLEQSIQSLEQLAATGP